MFQRRQAGRRARTYFAVAILCTRTLAHRGDDLLPGQPQADPAELEIPLGSDWIDRLEAGVKKQRGSSRLGAFSSKRAQEDVQKHPSRTRIDGLPDKLQLQFKLLLDKDSSTDRHEQSDANQAEQTRARATDEDHVLTGTTASVSMGRTQDNGLITRSLEDSNLETRSMSTSASDKQERASALTTLSRDGSVNEGTFIEAPEAKIAVEHADLGPGIATTAASTTASEDKTLNRLLASLSLDGEGHEGPKMGVATSAMSTSSSDDNELNQLLRSLSAEKYGEKRTGASVLAKSSFGDVASDYSLGKRKNEESKATEKLTDGDSSVAVAAASRSTSGSQELSHLLQSLSADDSTSVATHSAGKERTMETGDTLTAPATLSTSESIKNEHKSAVESHSQDEDDSTEDKQTHREDLDGPIAKTSTSGKETVKAPEHKGEKEASTATMSATGKDKTENEVQTADKKPLSSDEEDSESRSPHETAA
eukprot:TRINITY_DN28151_c0_g1_i1.p1 TRINITY_DN28151_c0_g1~~TRINITY_DN28151_c0_g1_i1.p1  ORF type:complete len:480 (-),score=48.81 TRINITY_DN28151_c0_g1_i1:61-1500(-)